MKHKPGHRRPLEPLKSEPREPQGPAEEAPCPRPRGHLRVTRPPLPPPPAGTLRSAGAAQMPPPNVAVLSTARPGWNFPKDLAEIGRKAAKKAPRGAGGPEVDVRPAPDPGPHPAASERPHRRPTSRPGPALRLLALRGAPTGGPRKGQGPAPSARQGRGTPNLSAIWVEAREVHPAILRQVFGAGRMAGPPTSEAPPTSWTFQVTSGGAPPRSTRL